MTITRPKPTEATFQFSSGTVYVLPTGFKVNDYLIDRPGEYDVSGIAFDAGEGYSLIHAEQQRVLVIPADHTNLANDTMSELEDVELVVTWSDADDDRRKLLARLIADLEPRGVVVFGTADEAKALTGQAVEPVSKLKLQSSDLQGEELRVWTVGE